MDMDPLDAFYQQLDSEQLLNQHREALVRDAREILAKTPTARVAGLITTPDSQDAPPLRKMLEQMSGATVPEGLMVGIVPRHAVEHLLAKRLGEDPWKEETWQPQQVLPVVVSTRDGFRFGIFGVGDVATQEE
jgi:hypothetical protein